MMEQEKILSAVLPLAGGQENITRQHWKGGILTLLVKDRSAVNLDQLKALPEIQSADLGRNTLRITPCGTKQEEEFMAMDNKKIAADILTAVGGKENVTNATHCMTRLRLNLKDDSIPKDEEVKKINGVMGVVRSGGQYQIIVGQNVPKVYNEFCGLGGFAVQAGVKENLDAPKAKLTPKQVGSNILNYLSGCMTPLIPVLIAAGLLKTLLTILGPELLGIISAESDAYALLDFLYDAGFYFIPILIGFNAAKKLGVNPQLGAYMGAILMAPDFMAMVSEGRPFTILGFNVVMADYSQTVLPIIVSAAFMCFVYKLIAKVMPDTLSTIFTPFLTMLISAPVALLFLAPIGTIIGNGISGGLVWFGNTTGFIGVAFIGAIWEFLVMTGMHMVVIMPFMLSYFEVGYQAGAIMGANAATWACFGVALGAFLRLRNKSDKSMSLGCFVSGLLGGVTEPALYGLCFKFKRCFIALAIGGAIGGAYMGLFDVKSYVMTSTNFLGLLSYTGGSSANFVNGCIACLLSLISAAVATYLLGFSKEELNPDE